MTKVRPPTPRFQIGQTPDGQPIFPSTELIQTLEELIQRVGGLGNVTLLSSLSVGASTDNAVARFDGTGGDKLQNSPVTISDAGSIGVPAGETVDGRDLSVDGSKLDGIEAGATADQTAAEIKTAYESNADTNAFTDSEQTKLAGIEAGAEVNDVDSVAGKTGAVTLDTDDVSEATNLYFTDERAQDAVGTITSGDGNVTTNYDDVANTLTIGLASTLDLTGKTLSFPTENVALVDAGSTGATEQDWIEVTVGGNTGYLRVYAST